MLKNPLLSGSYPDPSVCKRGDDYYLVASSFEFFPGIPLFYSRDFVHWKQICNVLSRPEQLDLSGVKPSKGIYAVSIRYREHDGYFYISTTLVKDTSYWGNINFYVRAKNPSGPWSDPIIVQGAEGIDPTLFFEGDKAYYLGNLRPHPEHIKCPDRYIWLQELDMETGRLVGERWILREDGALYHAATPEGPRMYKIGDMYYLLIAEGGTSYNHSVTVFRSRSINGPYEGNPRNPILTHRHMRRDYPINSTGHADLIQLANGEWWAVLLASRPDDGDWHNLGRETFAVPVYWEDEWPLFSPETGRVEFNYQAPRLPVYHFHEQSSCDQFESTELRLEWNFLRTPHRPVSSLTDRPGWLRLYLNGYTLRELQCPAFVGRRQQHMCFSASTFMEFIPDSNSSCGLVMLMNNTHYISMLFEEKDSQLCVSVYRCLAGIETCMGSIPFYPNKLWMRVCARNQNYSFYVAEESEKWLAVAEKVDGTLLSKDVAGGFTGAYVGLYGFNGNDSARKSADFKWFEYQAIDT